MTTSSQNVTRDAIEGLEQALIYVTAHPEGDPVLQQAEEDGLRSQIAELRQQIEPKLDRKNIVGYANGCAVWCLNCAPKTAYRRLHLWMPIMRGEKDSDDWCNHCKNPLIPE